MRVGDKQTKRTNFRCRFTRYPSHHGDVLQFGVSSSAALSSQLAECEDQRCRALASLLGAAIIGNSYVSVPQVQFEDLGLTLKATARRCSSPRQRRFDSSRYEDRSSGVAAPSIASPFSTAVRLTSDDHHPVEGQTALLTSETSRNESEAHSIVGIPFLSEIPGFQGTDHITTKRIRRRVGHHPDAAHRPPPGSPLTTTRRLLANLSPQAAVGSAPTAVALSFATMRAVPGYTFVRGRAGVAQW